VKKCICWCLSII